METTSIQDQTQLSSRVKAAQNLARLLAPLLSNGTEQCPVNTQPNNHREILSAIQAFVSKLTPESPIYATFHDGRVHDPLGGGSYAFQNDIVKPVLSALINDEVLSTAKEELQTDRECKIASEICSNGHNQLPTRPIVIHAGAQPNNSPHAGTLTVFCYAFLLAREIRSRMKAMVSNTDALSPSVTVEITFVDTAPVPGYETEIKGTRYQKCFRDVPDSLNIHMADYHQVLQLLSNWSGISFKTTFQSEFFAEPAMPSILRYIIANHDILGRQLSPKYGKLALRAACPIPGCGLTEKHGRLNVYSEKTGVGTFDMTITFDCPHHGPHTISTSQPAEIARLEANAPARNLIRSMSQLLDTSTHHVRITGSDYAGMYQEVFLYRPLAGWSKATGLAAGRTPHILYAPLIVDWSGAKLSKSLYVREGGYETMELFGTEALCSFAQLKIRFGDDGAEGLRRLWEEVQRWLEDPKKLFRTFSVDYLQKVVMEGQTWE